MEDKCFCSQAMRLLNIVSLLNSSIIQVIKMCAIGLANTMLLYWKFVEQENSRRDSVYNQVSWKFMTNFSFRTLYLFFTEAMMKFFSYLFKILACLIKSYPSFAKPWFYHQFWTLEITYKKSKQNKTFKPIHNMRQFNRA